jgi:lipoyl(octanoyl) transferase
MEARGKFLTSIFWLLKLFILILVIRNVRYKDLGLIGFADAWDYQKKVLSDVQEIKQGNQDIPFSEKLPKYNYLLFCEHPHVYTLGKSGKVNNLLVNKEFLKQKGAEFYLIDRGGDITYHGPGQIVSYPIFDLEVFGIGVKQYVRNLEEVIILTLKGYSLKGERLPGTTGVWLDVDKPRKTRKICAIGIKVSRSVTMHGFAFNVNTNLDYYNFINPCGFTDKGVTSLQKEIGSEMNIEEIKKSLLQSFEKVFTFEIG